MKKNYIKPSIICVKVQNEKLLQAMSAGDSGGGWDGADTKGTIWDEENNDTNLWSSVWEE